MVFEQSKLENLLQIKGGECNVRQIVASCDALPREITLAKATRGVKLIYRTLPPWKAQQHPC